MTQQIQELLNGIERIINTYCAITPLMMMPPGLGPQIKQRDFYAALWSLSQLGEAGRPALPTLIERCIVQDDVLYGKREFTEDELVWIIDALGASATKEDKQVVGFFAEMFCDESQPLGVRESIAYLLGQFEIDSPEVIATIAALLSDPKASRLWLSLSNAVSQLNVRDHGLRAALINALSASEEDVGYPENYGLIHMRLIQVFLEKAWLPAEYGTIRKHMLAAFTEITEQGYHKLPGE